jgi:hypothetical protein
VLISKTLKSVISGIKGLRSSGYWRRLCFKPGNSWCVLGSAAVFFWAPSIWNRPLLGMVGCCPYNCGRDVGNSDYTESTLFWVKFKFRNCLNSKWTFSGRRLKYSKLRDTGRWIYTWPEVAISVASGQWRRNLLRRSPAPWQTHMNSMANACWMARLRFESRILVSNFLFSE